MDIGMAVPKPETVNQELAAGSSGIAKAVQKEERLAEEIYGQAYPDKHGHQLTKAEIKAAELYAAGYGRKEVGAALVDHFYPAKGKYARWPLTKRLQACRGKLRRMESESWFRDEIWATAVKDTDLASGQIMGGVVRKAKMGRVDAARLAMEVSGRHDPKGAVQATQVVVNFGGLPRPEKRAELELEAEEEDE